MSAMLKIVVRRILGISLGLIWWSVFGWAITFMLDGMSISSEFSAGFGGMAGALFFVVISYIIFREENVGNIKMLAYIIGGWGMLYILGGHEVFDIFMYAYGIGTMIGAAAIYFSSNSVAGLIHRVMRK